MKLSAPSGFYVYAHRRSDTGEIFYVGKGRKRRAWNRSSRNQFWQRIAAKTEVIIEIVRDNLSELCAFTLERIVIAGLRAKGIVLSNLSDGGEGQSGYKMPQKTKDILRNLHLGKKLTPEHSANISASLKGKPKSEKYKLSRIGVKHTEASKEKMRNAALGRIMSKESVEKMRKSKIGKPNSEAWHIKMKGRFSGEKNPHHCPILHTFEHAEHGIRVCTQYELRSEYGLTHSNLSKMVSGLRSMVGGWRLVKE